MVAVSSLPLIFKRLAKPKPSRHWGRPGGRRGGRWAHIWQTSGPVPASRIGCLLVTWRRPIAKHFRIWYLLVKAAENGVLSTATPNTGPRRFKLVLVSCAKLGRFLRLLAFFSQRPILAPQPLLPEMDFSRSTAGHSSQYMWDFVPICPLVLAS
jgi:hypothetical protein